MQYQVLARKWRPQSFHELVGQEHVSRTLLNALQSGRVAHAFLFAGPRGSGKTSTARILAKALNCHEARSGEPCGTCIACREITAGNCLDVLEIDAASNTGVDNVRNLIEELQYRPARDRNKIYIIDEVHMLSTAAFNALLKTLEEPPPHVVFIMATTEYHKIPATILSRCQQYTFKLVPFPLILERLRAIAAAETIQISATSLEQIAFSSGGSMRDAMSAFDQVIAFSGQTVRDEDVSMLLGLVEPAILGNTVRAVASNDVEKILGIVADLVSAGQDLQSFCRRLLGQFRDLMVAKAGVTESEVLGVPESMLPDLKEQAALFSREDLLRLFDALLRVEADLKHATQTRFQLEMGLVELAQLPRMRSLEELIADFSRLIQKSPSGGRPSTQSSPASPLSFQPRGRTEGKGSEPDPPIAGPVGRAQAGPATSAPSAAPPAAPPDGSSAGAGDGPPPLLEELAAACNKESLAPILHSLAGARIQGDSVLLDLGNPPNEFLRRQLKDNIAILTQAAIAVVGRRVEVLFDESPAQSSSPAPASPQPAGAGGGEETLQKARRNPVVQSFLDAFPGPVKAEKIDP